MTNNAQAKSRRDGIRTNKAALDYKAQEFLQTTEGNAQKLNASTIRNGTLNRDVNRTAGGSFATTSTINPSCDLAAPLRRILPVLTYQR